MISSFLHSVSSVAVILLMTAVGYLCARMGWLEEKGKVFITRFLMRVCIPCMILTNFQKNFSREGLLSAAGTVGICLLVNIVLFIIAWEVGRLMKLPRKSMGVFASMCALSNAMFIGYPMCYELFGEECVLFVMMFYLASTTSVQSIEGSVIRISAGEKERFSGKQLLSVFKLPTLIAILIASVLVLAGIRIPDMLMSTMGYFSGCVTPLALVLTGYIICVYGFKRLKIDRTILVMLLFRFILSPVVFFLIFRPIATSSLMLQVMVVESAMPVVSQTVVFASEYGADEELAARGAAITTLGSFIEIPILMLLLNLIG